MEQVLMILSYAPEALGALLMILGGLKILARYTETKADDKVLEAIEKPVKMAKDLADKLKKK